MRNTKARNALIDIFSKKGDPLSALKLLSLLVKKGITVNKTTIYRELEFLKKSAIIREVVWDDSIMRFEAADPHCHHHIVCKNCGQVKDIDIEEKELFKLIESQSHFKLDKHIIEFFGLCTNCI